MSRPEYFPCFLGHSAYVDFPEHIFVNTIEYNIQCLIISQCFLILFLSPVLFLLVVDSCCRGTLFSCCLYRWCPSFDNGLPCLVVNRPKKRCHTCFPVIIVCSIQYRWPID